MNEIDEAVPQLRFYEEVRGRRGVVGLCREWGRGRLAYTPWAGMKERQAGLRVGRSHFHSVVAWSSHTRRCFTP